MVLVINENTEVKLNLFNTAIKLSYTL